MAWLDRYTGTDGRPCFYVRWRDPKSGKKHQRNLGPVPEEAARAARDRIALDEEGLVQRAAGLTHRQALARFLKHLRFLERSAATVRYYDAMLTPLFDELAERAAMKRWHPGHLGEVLAAHPRWSPRSIQMRLTGCRRFVRWARRARVAVPEFVEDMKGPKVTVREVAPYSPADVVKILDAAEGTHLEEPVSLALLTGLSLGDLRELRWGDVTFERLKPRAKPTAAWIRRKRAKTRQPVEVAVRGRLVELLAERAQPDGLVCDGLPRDKNNAKRGLQRLLRRARVSHGGWHRLRHTCGSMLVATGADLATIAKALGHAPGSTMTLRYVHSDVSRIAAAAVGVEGLVARAEEAARAKRRSAEPRE